MRMRLMLVLLAFSSAYLFSAEIVYHTHPKDWKEPRHFQQALDAADKLHSRFVERIVMTPFGGSDGGERVYSPNNAYYVACIRSDWPRERDQEVSSYLRVFDERQRGFLIELKDVSPQSCPDVRWVNEKLLFVRVWWGSLIGSDLVIDVEARRIMYHELVYTGWQTWQQHHAPPEP